MGLFEYNTTKAIIEHGKINFWGVSKVTDVSNIFKDCASCCQEIKSILKFFRCRVRLFDF
jgi:hypothetical protein